MTIPPSACLRIPSGGPNGLELELCGHDANDTPLSGATSPRGLVAYQDPQGIFATGVWSCDAGTIRIVDLSIDEGCYVVEGEVVITDEATNVSERFVVGEAFVLRKGFTGTWHMPVAMKKFNATFKR